MFTDRSYGDLSSRHWNPGLGGLVWGWDPSLLRYPSLFLSTTCGYRTAYSTSPHLHPATPPTHLDECDCFNSLVVGLPHSSIFWRFWVTVVLQFSCNFCCGCARGWAVFTYASILTRIPRLLIIAFVSSFFFFFFFLVILSRGLSILLISQVNSFLFHWFSLLISCFPFPWFLL